MEDQRENTADENPVESTQNTETIDQSTEPDPVPTTSTERDPVPTTSTERDPVTTTSTERQEFDDRFSGYVLLNRQLQWDKVNYGEAKKISESNQNTKKSVKKVDTSKRWRGGGPRPTAFQSIMKNMEEKLENTTIEPVAAEKQQHSTSAIEEDQDVQKMEAKVESTTIEPVLEEQQQPSTSAVEEDQLVPFEHQDTTKLAPGEDEMVPEHQADVTLTPPEEVPPPIGPYKENPRLTLLRAKQLLNAFHVPCVVGSSTPGEEQGNPTPYKEDHIVTLPDVSCVVGSDGASRFNVTVAKIINPAEFYVMLNYMEDQYITLYDCMNEYFAEEVLRNPDDPLATMEYTDFCAINDGGQWKRGEVVLDPVDYDEMLIGGRNTIIVLYKVKLLDEVRDVVVPGFMIRYLPARFCRLRGRVIQCRLGGIQPCGGSWTEESTQEFHEFVNGCPTSLYILRARTESDRLVKKNIVWPVELFSSCCCARLMNTVEPSSSKKPSLNDDTAEPSSSKEPSSNDGDTVEPSSSKKLSSNDSDTTETSSVTLPIPELWISLNYLLRKKYYAEEDDEFISSEWTRNDEIEEVKHILNLMEGEQALLRYCLKQALGYGQDTSRMSPEEGGMKVQWFAPDPVESNVFTGKITFVDDDCGIYIQDFLKNSTGMLNIINDEVNGLCEGTEPEPDIEWEVGDICLALYYLDDKWYRAEITKVNVLQSGQHVVRFVDYGNEEYVLKENLRRPFGLTMRPIQAQVFYFDDLAPITENWEKPALEVIFKLLGMKVARIEVRQLTSGFLGIAKMIFPDNTNALDMIVDRGAGKYLIPRDDSDADSYIEVGLPFKCFWWDRYQHGRDKEGRKYELLTISEPVDGVLANINSIVNPDLFIIEISGAGDNHQLMVQLECLIDLQYSIQNDAEKQPICFPTGEFRECIAMFEGCWCRAVVVDGPTRSNTVTIQYVDYGHTEEVAIVDIREMKDEWFAVPAHALPCRLFGYKYCGLFSPREAMSYLEEREMLSCDYIASIKKIGKNRLYVEIRRESGQLLYQDLIDAGFYQPR